MAHTRLALAVLFVGLFVPSALAGGGSSQRYTAAPGDIETICKVGASTVNLGGACFDVQGWTALGITVSDDSSLPVAVLLTFKDASGARVGSGIACGEGALQVPPTAATVVVATGQAFGFIACATAPAIAGNIEVFPAVFVG